MKNWVTNLGSSLSLFSSLSTLICCALPALFSALGAGAAVAGLVSNVPELIWLSEHKEMLFIIAGIFLGIACILRYLNKNSPCPADSKKGRACMRLRRINSILFWISVAFYFVGFFFAYLAQYLLV